MPLIVDEALYVVSVRLLMPKSPILIHQACGGPDLIKIFYAVH